MGVPALRGQARGQNGHGHPERWTENRHKVEFGLYTHSPSRRCTQSDWDVQKGPARLDAVHIETGIRKWPPPVKLGSYGAAVNVAPMPPASTSRTTRQFAGLGEVGLQQDADGDQRGQQHEQPAHAATPGISPIHGARP